MIELSKHIEYLLLKHNCVIVPNLGGFVTQYIPARLIAEENLYLPPCRNIGFNPQLTLNDGLLAQSYMQAYDTSYPETVRLIEEAVSKAKEELQEKGELELHGIGRLILSIDGKYDFEPNEAGVLSPDLYALDSFRIKTIPHGTKATDDEKPERLAVSPAKRKKTYTLNINKELVNYTAAAIAAIFFYFAWATPVAEESENMENTATMLFPVPQKETSPAPHLSLHQEPRGELQNSTQQEDNERIASATGSDKVPEKDGYTLVLLSSVPRKNAEAYIKKLSEEGIENVSLYERKKMVRVVYGRFDSERNAYTELNRLHGNEYFKEAWVMQLKPELRKH